MKKPLIALITLMLAAVYFGRPAKGDDTPKEQQYLRVFYCWNTQSVTEQRQAGKHKVIVGYSLPSLDPYSDDTKSCTKSGGVMMTGYVQITPPFASPDEAAAPTRN
jgi:hypothetical protein